MGRLIVNEWKRIRKPAAAAVCFLLVFVLVLYLYDVSLEPILYGLALCLAGGVGMTLVDGMVAYRRCQKLRQLQENLEDSLLELPKPKEEMEELYQACIRQLQEENRQLANGWQQNYEDLQDYYTTWAHQVKTPIAAMRLLLQTEECCVGGQLQLELFKIEQYVELALGYLRTEDISRDMRIQEYSLDGIIRQAVKKYARMFIMEKIALEYEPVQCLVLTDEKWLLFVLEQILSNSLKYTHQGKISIYMAKDQEKTLVIEDTGIGISAQDLPRVFERGFTGCNGREDKRSTGIGLYSVKKVMKKLSHEITITSLAGVGTKVFLHLERASLELL